MTTIFSNRGLRVAVTLSTVIAVTFPLAACVTPGGMGPEAPLKAVAAQPAPPPPEDPAALTYRFLAGDNVIPVIDPGMKPNGQMRPEREPTYFEAMVFTGYRQFCAAQITKKVFGTGWTIAKRVARTGSTQTLASFLSVPIAFAAPTDSLYRQVPGIGGPLAFMASWDAEDKNVFMTLAGGHAGCVIEMIKRNQSLTPDLMGVSVPGLKVEAMVPTAPGVEAPTPDDD